jgi:S-adenosylmethionine:tRNA ribosyltransferase-isomerase
VAEVIDNTTSRGRTLRFLYDGPHEDFKKLVYSLGETPLPKYIERPVEPEDAERYQTIYAKYEGAVAAPTAGLHFSKQLSKRLEIAGIHMAELTLHIGLGTFRTVEVEDLTKHKTDSEQLIIPEVTADLVNDAREKGKRVCAVGTTTLRAFESSVGTNNTLKAFDGWASKFIFPPHDFQIADSLITNFHEPQSVLLMMTTAFGGYDFVMEAYKEAIKKKYRFFCYGDAMLII